MSRPEADQSPKKNRGQATIRQWYPKPEAKGKIKKRDKVKQQESQTVGIMLEKDMRYNKLAQDNRRQEVKYKR